MPVFHKDDLPLPASLGCLWGISSVFYPICGEFDGLGCVAEVFDPVDIGFAAEPGELAFGVVAMALLSGGDGFGFGHGSVDCGDGLAVAEGVQGFHAAVLSQEGAGFLDEARLEHGCGAVVDAVVELLTGWVEADSEEAEAGEGIAGDFRAGFERGGEWLAGGEADFEGTDEFWGVVGVDTRG